jgi:hypothetical protein
MPFKNDGQRKACWARRNRAAKTGKKSGWDCRAWEKETPSRIPGMKKEASTRFTTAFQDELSKLSAKPFPTAAESLGAAFKKKKAPIKKLAASLEKLGVAKAPPASGIMSKVKAGAKKAGKYAKWGGLGMGVYLTLKALEGASEAKQEAAYR